MKNAAAKIFGGKTSKKGTTINNGHTASIDGNSKALDNNKSKIGK